VDGTHENDIMDITSRGKSGYIWRLGDLDILRKPMKNTRTKFKNIMTHQFERGFCDIFKHTTTLHSITLKII
jgi:hypothetical protein